MLFFVCKDISAACELSEKVLSLHQTLRESNSFPGCPFLIPLRVFGNCHNRKGTREKSGAHLLPSGFNNLTIHGVAEHFAHPRTESESFRFFFFFNRKSLLSSL